MNNYDLEAYLESLIRSNNSSDIFSGGNTTATKYEVIDEIANNNSPTIEKHKPIYTRPIISKYEYVGAITTLAEYLESLDTVEKYTDAIEVDTLINPSELAFRLIKCGKMDCNIIRNGGMEKVTLSELARNPLWDDVIEEYFQTKTSSMAEELYSVLEQAK